MVLENEVGSRVDGRKGDVVVEVGNDLEKLENPSVIKKKTPFRKQPVINKKMEAVENPEGGNEGDVVVEVGNDPSEIVESPAVRKKSGEKKLAFREPTEEIINDEKSEGAKTDDTVVEVVDVENLANQSVVKKKKLSDVKSPLRKQSKSEKKPDKKPDKKTDGGKRPSLRKDSWRKKQWKEKLGEVTKMKAEELEVIVENPGAPSPSITTKVRIKGRIEEGDGLFEERSSTSSDDDQAASLLQTEPMQADSESSLAILTQVMLPFLVAGLGMVGAGLVLDLVQHWAVFRDVSELFIMVPALLGLKGNLEMTLASRLSTHANLGHLDNRDNRLSMIVGNMALIQCQAIVVGFLASVAAVVMGWIPEGHFDLLHALLLCAAALVTASVASLILSTIMVGVILASRKCRINPDNVATPIAASLGDLTTLGLLAGIASVLYNAKGTDIWVSPLIVVGYLLSLPLWIWLASRNKHTKEVLYSGWTPVISAMMISSMGGLILDFTVSSYKGIAVFQPVINGVGGNLVAVQASRISTALHATSPLGKLPKFAAELCINPCSAFCAGAGHPRTARVLLSLVVPGHIVFMYTISYLKAGHTSLTPIFVVTYLLAAFLQVAILLYVAHVMVHWMWKTSIDPDNSAIPYLTAMGDLIGTGLLAIAFHFLYLVGDGDSDLGD